MRFAVWSLFCCLCTKKKETASALWHFHCDQLLPFEQSPNCGGFLARWEKTLGIAKQLILSAPTLCPTVQKYVPLFERHCHML